MPHSVLVVCDLHNGLPVGDDAGLVEVDHGLGVGCQGLTIVESIVHIDLQHRAVLELAWGRGREREEERERERGELPEFSTYTCTYTKGSHCATHLSW